ncbi:hypothetical protein [Curtobacterium sp. PhB115]|uniref:hypothetical protein n=1 Tax=Curtobacterium sp. PhB115 TaxID=2485173 RepID=UPI000FAC4D97|nr:hypothetical protein [Curtobacterium sp. PhB115]ROP66961.1 hypothetical protein EDF19_2308 [Curtobacterium sp. PhB115]
MAKIHGNDPTGYSSSAADALKSASTALASSIGGQSGSRSSSVTTASAEFRGYFSEVFADNADIASRSATKLVESLQSLSGFVQQLRDAAKDEDDRRKQAKEWTAGLILSHAEAMEIADSKRQLIDGEFLGYLPGSDLTDESNLVVRIDAFDSGEWTVTVRPPLTTMSEAFDRTHGPARPGRPATRLEEFGPRQQTTL